MRFLCRPHKAKAGDAGVEAEIISFLQSMYDSVAETLPGVRNSTAEPDDDQVKVSVLAEPMSEHQDEYAALLAAPGNIKPAKTCKPRKFKRSVQIVRSAMEVRFLPPGHMRDYWLQMNAARDDLRPISFSQFWRETGLQLSLMLCSAVSCVRSCPCLAAQVWYGKFSHLKFRQESQHAVCHTCLRRKLLIKDLSGHLLARKEQVRRYTEHLRAQYLDRCEYWAARGASRLKNGSVVDCIIDSMDQDKTMLPRASLVRAKDLATLQRPKLHLTAVVVHGWFVLAVVSDADMPKNSSVMIEIMSHALTILAQNGCRLCDTHVRIQSDNTTREMKNNPFLKWMTSQVISGLVPKCRLVVSENLSSTDPVC